MAGYSLKSFNEEQLASFQQAQLGNNCAYHAVSSAINILTGNQINGLDYADRVNAMPFPGSLKYRLWDNGPTLPFQQVNLAKMIAEDHGIQISAERKNPSAEELRISLLRKNEAVLVTIGWVNHQPPEITYGIVNQNLNASPAWLGWHTMLLAYYNQEHISVDGIQRPWGLINSWVTGGKLIYWMRDSEFLRSWGTYTPFSGTHASVILRLL